MKRFGLLEGNIKTWNCIIYKIYSGMMPLNRELFNRNLKFSRIWGIFPEHEIVLLKSFLTLKDERIVCLLCTVLSRCIFSNILCFENFITDFGSTQLGKKNYLALFSSYICGILHRITSDAHHTWADGRSSTDAGSK